MKRRSQAVELWLQPEIFKALADETRLAVLARIAVAGRPMTVSEIKDCCGIHLSGVSRHLIQLRRAGLVHAEKDGREVRYRLQADDVIALLRGLADSLESCGKNCCVEE
ncbi:MAG: metalloregulator ArsR/SmtB family transcription factor [Acidobacteriota bacterium]